VLFFDNNFQYSDLNFTRLFDITLLTDKRYLQIKEDDWYISNIITEDRLVADALIKKGLNVTRTNWDNPGFDWSTTRFAMFRTTWDYFDRFAEFDAWMTKASQQTTFINPLPLIYWNIDKHYLADLEIKGIKIPPTIFIETGCEKTLQELIKKESWEKYILKPAVSGAARHTYLFDRSRVTDLEAIFKELIDKESMLLQEYQHQITEKGEVALMLMGGKFTHAVLKKAKAGDFRVQDDFGGTLHEFNPDKDMIEFAEKIVRCCAITPAYARVDLIWSNTGELCLSELELIEPELWFRKHPAAADVLADSIMKIIA
jgi:glutathione synthase/RimK-type ligase-like ATP-grasp enzyme